jgi:hypothetical protein
MNSGCPPVDDVLDWIDQEEELQRIRLVQNLQRSREQRTRRRRQQQQQAEMSSSSDSEVEAVTNGVKSKMNLTPGESTPKDTPKEELVKLDPAEIGMSVGLKQLYSGKEDKRGRFQWQSEIPEDLGKPAEDAESE